ncbi:MBG domain-containing protein [Fulvivirga ulvae]|uniref:MBG domain-containing protein n=1 Tax=Fulvivirga ulvae TaxID=2904245 RepID=UPI001F35BC48|nr:MBG domain-containing protein [Fulvivirga ulvae]UII30954.1 MBG domain-containing protein [Fulvivirga ulvae]
MTATYCCVSLYAWAQSPAFTSVPVETGTFDALYTYDITTSGQVIISREILLTSGTFPDGITLTDNGDGTALMEGTPTETGSFPIELTVRETLFPINNDVQAFTLTIDKAAATVTLGTTSVVYSGSPQSATAATTPPGLTVDFTYDESSSPPTEVGTYVLEATINDENYEGSASGTFEITKAPATVTLGTTSVIYNGSPQSATATTTPPGLTVDFTYDGSSSPPTEVGTYVLEATINDENYEGSASGTFEITKAPATVTLGTTSVVYNGSPQSATAATTPPGLTVDFTYDGSNSPLTEVGSYALEATINDENYEGSASGTFEITKAPATVTLGTTSVVYNGSPQSATATTTPTGLAVDFTYNGSSSPPTEVGSYALEATIIDGNYEGSASGTFEITKANATITLGTTSVVYNGSGQSATATTSPADLDLIFTYDGSTSLPVNAGTYALEVTIDDPDYEGSVSGTFEITKAPATVTLGTTSVAYNGSPQSATATTSPSGLTVNFTYDGSASPPTSVGTYALLATINDANYEGSASGTFEITKANAAVSFTSLSAVFDGTPKMAAVTTTPSGLSVSFTYNGSPTPPTNAGSYNVVATVADPNYTGSASDVFVIQKGTATITFGSLAFIYDGTAKSATATTSPSGLAVNFTYNGSLTAPVNAGSYVVQATVNTPNYSGLATNTLTISKAAASITISNLNQNYDGSPKPVTVTTVPSGLTTIVTYNGSTAVPSASGSYAVQVTINETNYSGSASNTLKINAPPTTSGIADVPVNEDAANYFINLRNSFNDAEDGSLLTYSIVANTNPSLFADLFITSSGGVRRLTIDFAPDKYGDADITIRATDSGGLWVEDQFHVSVASVQDIPKIISDPVNGILQGENYYYEVIATDADEADVLTYTNVFKPAWLTFTDNGGGIAELSGVAAVSDIGDHFVSLEVSDNNGNKHTQNFTISVAASNEQPVFTSTPVTSVAEDAPYTYNITTTDPDNNNRTITAPTLPSWLTFTDHGNGTATLQGTPSNSNVGSHAVLLRVTDIFGISSDQSFSIAVSNTNDAPEFTSSPVISAKQSVTYTYSITTTDVDAGDSRSIVSTTTLPAWLSLTDNGNGSATLTGVHPVSETNNLTYPINLKVQDTGGASDTQSFTITVQYENNPPTLDPIADLSPVNEDAGAVTVPLSGITAGTGESQQLTVSAVSDNTDLINNFTINYTSPEPAGSLVFQPVADAYGSATVTVTVQDDGAAVKNSIVRTFLVTVNPINDKPVFTSSVSDIRVIVGEEYVYNITTYDADAGDVLAITGDIAAPWLSLSDTGDGTAVLSGTVPSDATGDFLVTLTVTDMLGEFSTQSYTIGINRLPVVSDVGITVNEDEGYSLGVSDFSTGYQDPDGDNIDRIRIETLPSLMGSFEWKGTALKPGDEVQVAGGNISGLIYTGPKDQSGQTTFNWSAYDGYNWSQQSAKATINIVSVNDVPFLTHADDTLYYSQGDAARSITETLIINDVDNADMAGATIKIETGYVNGEDVLLYDNTLNANITGSFEASQGVLTLSGADKRSAYEDALANVQYRNTVLGVTDVLNKSVSVTVSDGIETSNKIIRQIKIAEVLPEVKIFSAFTPNEDGSNDTWYFDNLGFYSVIKISVFDEKGIKVFNCSTNDCQWDGTYNGKPLAAGPYFYTIDLNNGKRKYKGTVTIFK